MSMILGIVALRDENLQRLLDDPPLVWQAIAPDDSEAYDNARADQSKGGLLARLLGRGTPLESAPDLELTPEERLTTDLDKAWHGIHYLLTGTAWEGDPPGNLLVTGGREVGDLDVGYGPARVLTSVETRASRDWLNNIEEDELRRRFNPEDMRAKEIYPDIWERDPEEDDTLEYLVEYARTLRNFLNRAVDQGLGIVVYLS
jgi:Domain of unknown function (DUF1877)